MIGTTVSHYRVLEQLGGGGMGVVYRAEDIRLGRGVALKFLPVDRSRDPDSLERFAREARLASALNHPNICTLYEVGEHEGRPYLVMELLEGETLKHRLAAGPLPADLVLELAIQLADGLEAAHEAGIIHRDLKPANVFLTSRGYLKILDFGLAKLTGGRADTPSSSSRMATAQFPSGATETSDLTRPGFTLGTVAYMSPEQVRGEDVDERSDIFSLGALLHELATGKQAFGAATTGLVWDGILHESPPPVAAVRGDLAAGFEDTVARALEKDPELRYQSAADLRADLLRLRRDSQAGEPAVSPSAATRSAATRSAATRSAAASSATRLAESPSLSVDSTPAGRADTATDSQRFAPAPAGRSSRALAAVAALAALLALVAVFTWWRGRTEPAAVAAAHAVAVLPFENLSGDAALDHLHLAVPDEVNTVLSRTPSLAVRPFAMTRSYAVGGRLAGELADIGREVDADRLVTGHYSREAGALRLTLEAIDVGSRQIVWRESLDVPADDMLALRERTARRVRDGLLPVLLPALAAGPAATEADAGTAPTSNEAYDLFLRSLALPDDLQPARIAIDLLERAASLDPGYAPIWRELASRYHTQATYGAMPGETGKAIAAADRALALDPQLLGAASTSILLHTETGDLVSARRRAAEVVERRSEDSDAHFTLAYVLRYGGALDEANRECETALSLEPANRRIRSCTISFYLAGDYDRALDFIRLDAGTEWARIHTVQIRMRKGERARTLELLEQLPEWSFTGLLKAWYTDPSSPELPALAAPLEAERTAARDPELKYHAAATFALTGLAEPALRLLRQAIDGGYCSYPAIETDPLWDGLREVPAMTELAEAARDCQERFVGGS